MSTTTRNRPLQPFLMTMLLGLVMAAGIWAFAEPAFAWAGFAMAAMYRSAVQGRGCLPGYAGRARS